MKIKDWKEPSKSPKPAVDVIIEKNNKIILIDRVIEPFKGKLDLVGGHVEYGETVEDAAVREAKEETGLTIKLKDILGVYSDKNRDPRTHTVTTVFVAEPINEKLEGSFEGKPHWSEIDKIDFNKLGFDHAKVLKDYIKWRKKKGTYWSTK